MPTNRTKQVLQDISVAIGDAEAQLPAARELIKIMQDANEDTTDVRALMADIDARIRQWRRVIEREGIEIPPPVIPETE